MSATTGTDAATPKAAQGRDRMRSPAVTIPAASTPIANSTARSGVKLSTA